MMKIKMFMTKKKKIEILRFLIKPFGVEKRKITAYCKLTFVLKIVSLSLSKP